MEKEGLMSFAVIQVERNTTFHLYLFPLMCIFIISCVKCLQTNCASMMGLCRN